jgi:Mg-chelatase subunit ChlD
VSPQTGALDQAAFDELATDDLDAALALLADLSGATDPRLRALARQLAGRVVIDLAAPVSREGRGSAGRLRTTRLPDTGGDLDLDASLGPLIEARAGGRPPSVDDLRGRWWAERSLALCLVVDRSGSMGGERLATAAVAAACLALRAPDDHSVLAFSDRTLVLQRQGGLRSTDEVIGDLLSLRGHGTTDLAGALHEATVQLARSRAHRRLAILLSDGRPTAGDDPIEAARSLTAVGELAVLAPHDDAEEARALAESVGGRCQPVTGPSSVPAALAALFAR